MRFARGWPVMLIMVAACAEGDADGAAADGDAAAGAAVDTAAGAGALAQPIFSIDGLDGPEAVKFDPDQDAWFVSSFGPDVEAEDGRDANGTIARASADGAQVDRGFIRGTEAAPLHMPRGMALSGDTLWVADVDGVHGFDRRTGRALAFIDFTTLEPGFLNDIAVGPQGALYVTDTGLGRVYRVAGAGTAAVAERGGARPIVAIEDSLTGPPNGITWDPEREAFLLAPWGGGQVLRAWAPGEMSLDSVVSVPGGRFDGIELVDGRVLVASQVDSSLWLVEGGTPRRALRVPGRPADIGVDVGRGRVAVPYIALGRVDVFEIPAPAQ